MTEPVKIPVGSPCSSFSIQTSPTRSGVSRVIPSTCSALEFIATTLGITGARAKMMNGLSGAAVSSTRRSGSFPSVRSL